MTVERSPRVTLQRRRPRSSFGPWGEVAVNIVGGPLLPPLFIGPVRASSLGNIQQEVSNNVHSLSLLHILHLPPNGISIRCKSYSEIFVSSLSTYFTMGKINLESHLLFLFLFCNRWENYLVISDTLDFLNQLCLR